MLITSRRWRWEIANVLQLNVRRGRYSADFRDGALASLALLSVKVDAEADRRAWGATLHLAEHHRITIYDAADLEIAIRRKIPLATLDRDLRWEAASEGIALLRRVSVSNFELFKPNLSPPRAQ